MRYESAVTTGLRWLLSFSLVLGLIPHAAVAEPVEAADSQDTLVAVEAEQGVGDEVEAQVSVTDGTSVDGEAQEPSEPAGSDEPDPTDVDGDSSQVADEEAAVGVEDATQEGDEASVTPDDETVTEPEQVDETDDQQGTDEPNTTDEPADDESEKDVDEADADDKATETNPDDQAEGEQPEDQKAEQPDGKQDQQADEAAEQPEDQKAEQADGKKGKQPDEATEQQVEVLEPTSVKAVLLRANEDGTLVLEACDDLGSPLGRLLPNPLALPDAQQLLIDESVKALSSTAEVAVHTADGQLLRVGTLAELLTDGGILAPKTVTFMGSGLETLSGAVFANSTALEVVVGLEAQDLLTELPEGCFEGCANLSEVSLPQHLQALGTRAFAGCQSLAALGIPTSVTRIGSQAFEGCSVLTELHLLAVEAPVLDDEPSTFRGTPMEGDEGWIYVPAAGLQSYLDSWPSWESRITIEPGTEDGLELSPMTGDRSTWVRIAGTNAYGTMQKVLQTENVFAKGRGGAVVVATSGGYWDALSAAGLAGRLDAPIVITPTGSLASEAKAEIQRLRPTQVIVAGGSAAISDAVFKELQKLCPKVSRVAGKTAPDTAVKLYQRGSGWGTTLVVATSNGYWDALSVAPYAYRYGAPIFLTNGTTDANGRVLSAGALAAIKSGGFKEAIIVGGKAAVASSVEGQLKNAGVGSVKRLAGKTALDTSAEIAKWELGKGMVTEHLTVATSNGYWDALSGAPLAGQQNSVLVLVGKDGGYQALDAVYDYANQGKVPHGHVLGGTAAVSKATWDRITAGWALTGIKLGQSVMRAGSSVTVTPTISGDASKITYNYGWKKDNSSADADWWSVKKQTGKYTSDKSRSMYIGSPGTFDVFVDAVDASGAKQTLHATLKVWGLVGLKVSAKSESSWTAAANLGSAGSSATGVSFRFTWKRAADGKTGVVRDWGKDASVTFDAGKLGKVPGRYDITVEMKDSAGKVESKSASLTFAPNGKIGYQTPGSWPKVSSYNVVLPSYCTGYHTYVSPSKISIDATREQCIEAFIQRATEYLGTTYIEPYSREPGNAVDCSGLVLQCLYATGMDLEHARGTESVGGYNPYNHYWVPAQTYNSMRWYENDTFMPVSLDNLQRGDIVFYSGHVAIYIGNGKVIHSSNYMVPFNGVQVSDLWHRDVIGAQRPFPA